MPRKRGLICGIGINDSPVPIWSGGKHGTRLHSYRVWQDMIRRCGGDPTLVSKCPSYEGCTICEEWKRYSVFLSWYNENYREGSDLDKDILYPDNKVYSPQTCAFVPRYINELLPKRKFKNNGERSHGVYFSKTRNRYVAQLTDHNKTLHIGSYLSFDEAFAAYKTAKESYIKKIAREAYERDEIDSRVFNALMNYKIELC